MDSRKIDNASMLAMIAGIWRHRGLLGQMIMRDVAGRYRGSWLGLGWSFFNPIVLLVIYTFFFSVIFKARWDIDGYEGKAAFAMILFVGLILHGLLAECVNRAPSLIIGNVNYVKRVVFPLEILPCIAMGSALFHAAINLVVLLAAQMLLTGQLQWTAIFIPLVILPLALTGLGIAWLLASLGAFVRDVGQITGFLMTVLLFLSPIFYPVSAMPEQYRAWLLFNPLTFIIEQARAVLILGGLPDFFGLALASWVGLVVAWAGYWWFQKTRKGFSDVL